MPDLYFVFHSVDGGLRLVARHPTEAAAFKTARDWTDKWPGQKYIVMRHIFSVQSGPYQGGVDG